MLIAAVTSNASSTLATVEWSCSAKPVVKVAPSKGISNLHW